jgi:hypothetical protein
MTMLNMEREVAYAATATDREKLAASSRTFVRVLLRSLVPPSLIDVMGLVPEGYFPEVTQVLVQFGGSWRNREYLRFETPLRVPYFVESEDVKLPARHPLRSMFRDLVRAKNKIEKRRVRVVEQLRRLVGEASGRKQLLAAWPDARRFVPSPVVRERRGVAREAGVPLRVPPLLRGIKFFDPPKVERGS